MAERIELVKGTLDLLVMQVLEGGAQHGHGIAQRLKELSDEVIVVEEGSLYPALHRLERRGELTARWGRSESNRRARFYKLSARGRRSLERERINWERAASAIALVLETGGAT